jgi:hypothetical protein
VPRRTLPLVVAAFSVALLALAPLAPARAALPPLRAPADLKELSYYPSDGGWSEMWDDFRPARLQADFARIAALHANTVRLILQAGTFGYPLPSLVYEAELAQAIDLAEAAGLHVQLTLFDWLGQHGLAGSYADIDGSKRWAAALLAPYAGDPRIACVELQNELDPHDPAAVTWARGLLPYVQRVVPGTPVTLSATGADQAAALALLQRSLAPAAPDFWSVHLFTGGGERTYWDVRAARTAVAPRPVWVGETGYPTLPGVSGYPDIPATADAQEAAQAHFLKTTAEGARRAGLAPIGIWTLDDFTDRGIPVDPGAEAPPAGEYHFGLFRTDGSAKPGATVIRHLFASGRPSLDFDNGFERGVSNGAGGVVPAEWSARADAGMEVAQDTAVAHRGLASARLRSLDGSAGGGFFSIVPVDATALRGTKAVAAVSVRLASRRAAVTLALQWFDAATRAVGTRYSRRAAPTRRWQELAVVDRAPRRARSVRIFLIGKGVTGSVWFDDVRFGWR